MGRLAEFEHHKIRDIDDVVDRTNPDAFNFRAQPFRTGPTFTLSILRSEKNGHSRVAEMFTPVFVGQALRLPVGNRSGCPTRSAAISRARPKWLSKSPRFGVISTSRIVSLGKDRRSVRRLLLRATRSTVRTHLRRVQAQSGCKAFPPIRHRAVCSLIFTSVRQLRAWKRERNFVADFVICRAANNLAFRAACRHPLRKRSDGRHSDVATMR